MMFSNKRFDKHVVYIDLYSVADMIGKHFFDESLVGH